MRYVTQCVSGSAGCDSQLYFKMMCDVKNKDREKRTDRQTERDAYTFRYDWVAEANDEHAFICNEQTSPT